MNNSFAIIVNTPPPNNKGIPYVIERLLMCGSAKVPVKDPLRHLSEKRSMNTYSEAFIGYFFQLKF